MASKTLVITSDTSSMQELVQDKRFLVNPYSIEDIFAKLHTVLHMSDADKQEVIERNYQFCQQFTREKSAQKYVDLFTRLGRKK